MEKRAHDIYEFIVNNPSRTEGEIARGVGLKRTPYTRWILLSLVEHNYIVRMWDAEHKPPAFIYYAQDTSPMNFE